MASNATQGTLLQLSIASTFTTIAQRVSVKPAELTRAKIETTDLDSTAETSIPGILRGGEVEIQCNWSPAATTHAALWTSFTGGTTEAWKFVFADTGAADLAFSGWISSFQPGEATVDGLQKLTLKIQVTGGHTLTP